MDGKGDRPADHGIVAAPEPLEDTALKMEGTLPSGVKVVMRELSGAQELAAAAEVGDPNNAEGQLRLTWAQTMRSLVELDGKPFDQSEHTCESFRNLFTSKEMYYVVDLFQQLNRPTAEESATFREGTKLTS